MVTTRTRLAEAVQRLDAISTERTTVTDLIDLSWMNNDDLVNLALDYERVKVMSNDDKEELIFRLGRALEERIYED